MQIGRYQVLEEIGRGGAGRVVRARAPDGRVVAIKILMATEDQEQQARFARESSLLAALGEGFVPILERGESPSGPYIVFPFLSGGTLRQRLAHGRLGVADAVALVRTLARALGRAHERGIVHRDLKPENILFTEDGRALVSDLGLAREGVGGHSLTRSGVLGGTLGYMPSEQMDTMRSAGPPADVFALGAILHECLTGERAFEAAGLLSYAQELTRGPRPLREACPEAPAWLAAVVARALARDPGERFAHGGALAAALGRGVPARRRTGWMLVLVANLALWGAALFSLTRPGEKARPPVVRVTPPTSPLALEVSIQEPRPDTLVSKSFALRARVRGPFSGKAEVALVLPDGTSVSTENRIGEGGEVEARVVVPRLDCGASVLVRVAGEKGISAVASVALALTQAPLTDLPLGLGRVGSERLPDGTRIEIYRYRFGDLELAMVFVPPGPFLSGDKRRLVVDDGPGFWIGRHEVTNGDYARYCAAAGEPAARLPAFHGELVNPERHPVVCMCLEDAESFCNWAHLELPSSAEWEKAARGTDGRVYPWGNDWDGKAPRANFADRSCPARYGHLPSDASVDIRDLTVSDGFPYTAPVGSFPLGVSPCGAFDMSGNAYEICSDGTIHGGSWWHDKRNVRAAATVQAAGNRGEDMGFRPVLHPGVR